MMKYLILCLILFNILLASRWIIDGNLFFHTDIARDFLLIEDIVDNKNITLIGPRSGAIPGLFHGPLWLYINVPAFLIGRGNPVFVGWFWVILYVLSLAVIYFVVKKMFGKTEGVLSALLLSSVTVLNVRSMFNPYGALILSPVFFYFFAKYLQTLKFKLLIVAFLSLGFIIQFQMAFGVPILILAVMYLACFLFKKKKLNHLINVFILVIPLSSFLLFDLRNNFLQVRSVISYLYGAQSHGKLDLNLFQLVALRMKESITDGLGMITQNNIYITLILLILFILSILINFKKEKKNLLALFLFLYFYLGFWLFAIFFKGPVWNYYFLPFVPMLIISFISLKSLINKIIFYFIFALIYFVNVNFALQDILKYNQDPPQQDVSTWKFNELVARNIFIQEESEFGYFIFTPDLYGYSPRYALNFYQKKEKDKKAYPYQKKAVTYLVIAPPPEYGKDPRSIWYQKNTNSVFWKSNDIRIGKKPISKISFKNSFVIERYNLSDTEIKIEPNPFLIKDIFFR